MRDKRSFAKTKIATLIIVYLEETLIAGRGVEFSGLMQPINYKTLGFVSQVFFSSSEEQLNYVTSLEGKLNTKKEGFPFS